MKEIINISVDEELDLTEVSIRVPQFENFGKRLGELERKASEAFRVRPEPESDPELEAEIEADLNETMESLKSSVNSMKKELEAMPDSPQKKAMMLMYEQFSKMDEETDEEDEVEGDRPVDEKDRFNYDLQALRVSLGEEMKWDKAAEATVDQFLIDWPLIRPAVLQATFKHYKKIYPELMQIVGESDEYAFTMPKPTSPEVVADLFTITAIYLHQDGSIGLGGHCTWDEEHGYGVRIKNGKIVEVGHESDAFS
jgi:hypothetical protein